ncbi:MAG: hypothetical protein A2104_08900 [Candidatus Melainabacteria bacterium GWF2_32_7]|nr:MAG: hypothetical protein A2104_08900 [Candidatus Melainabacteria bacterium GWF2_32_7]
MNIRIIDNEEDFLAIKTDWDRLAQDMISFNKFEWTHIWWKHFKEGNDLSILVAEKDGKTVGIAPLYVRNINVFKFLSFKKVTFLGGKISDYLDFLIQQDENRESTFVALLDYVLNKFSFDILELKQINSDYPNFDLWQKYSKKLGLKFIDYGIFSKCHILRLNKFDSYDEYFNQLGKNHKKSIKLRQNKVKKEFKNVEYTFKSDITPEDIRIIADINIKRQKFLIEKGKEDRFCYFTDLQEKNFISDYFCNSNSDSKMLAYLKCDDKVIAYNLILVNDKGLCYWNGAFDTDYEVYSPSKLLFNELIKYSYENNYEYFDFMRGSDPFKLQWTNDITTNYILSKKNFRAELAYLFKFGLLRPLVDKFRSTSIKSSLDEGGIHDS